MTGLWFCAATSNTGVLAHFESRASKYSSIVNDRRGSVCFMAAGNIYFIS
jgi:hypothetical protein